MNDELRTQARLLKARSGVSYKAIAAKLGIRPSTFYNWLSGQYGLSERRLRSLQEIILQIGGMKMSLVDYLSRNIPDYYPTMYQDGYTPEQILIAVRKKMHRQYEERRTAQEEVTNIHITSNVDV